MTVTGFSLFLTLNDIFEPSAIQQLPDGRFLVVEDEKARPLSLVAIRLNGTNHRIQLEADAQAEALKLDDLEGIATDTAGFVYGITSHSRNRKGETKPAREKLVRFRIEGNAVVAPNSVNRLKAALVAAHPVLAVTPSATEKGPRCCRGQAEKSCCRETP